MEKNCFKCQRLLPLSEFYTHPRMTDGHLGKCKACTKADVKRNYRRNHEHFRQYEKARFKTESRKQYRKRLLSEFRTREPQKYRARVAVGNAIRGGKLKRQPCEVCGDKRSEAHHEDYSQPLNVRWLCKRHHDQVHGKMLFIA